MDSVDWDDSAVDWIDSVDEATQNNDHGLALLLTAAALNLEEVSEGLKMIRKQHLALGHLPPHLYEQRDRLCQTIMAHAMEKLSSTDYEKLRAAF